MIETLPTIGLAMPTDADWGRLYDFNTTGDAGLIMPLRSYYFRDFFAGGWTDLAIGLIHATCGNTGGDTSALNDERQNETNLANMFHFGISKSTGSTLPVATNPYFVGLRSLVGGVTQINSGASTLGQLVMSKVEGDGLGTTNGGLIQLPLSQGISDNPFSMIGIRFTYDPLTSILYVNQDTQTNIALADEDANITTLTTFLNGLSNSITDSFAQFSIANLANFSTYYLYWPYILNKMKLHCVGAIKYG